MPLRDASRIGPAQAELRLARARRARHDRERPGEQAPAEETIERIDPETLASRRHQPVS